MVGRLGRNDVGFGSATLERDRNARVWFQCRTVAHDGALFVGDDAVTALKDGLRVEMGERRGQAGDLGASRVERLLACVFKSVGQRVEAAGKPLALRPGEHEALRDAAEYLATTGAALRQRASETVVEVVELLTLAGNLFGRMKQAMGDEVDRLLTAFGVTLHVGALPGGERFVVAR